MSIPTLKIKPPPIQWPILASLGVAAWLGSLIGNSIGPHQQVIGILPPLFIVASAGMVCTCKRKRTLLTLTTFLFFIVYSGVSSRTAYPFWVHELQGNLVQLDGTIVSTPTIKPRTSGSMQAVDYRPEATRFNMIATPRPLDDNRVGKTAIHVRVNGASAVGRGDSITCIGWLRQRGDHFPPTLYVSTPTLIHTTSTTKHSRKNRVEQSLTLGLTSQQTLLAKALLFGQRGRGWESLSRTYQRSGLSHILAISGLHVSALVMITTCFVTLICTRRGIATPLLLGIVLFSVSFIEIRPPILRAMFIVLLYFSFKLSGVKISTTGALGAAVICILCFSPNTSSSVGFQLSFLIVFALCALLPSMRWRVLGPTPHTKPTTTQLVYWLLSLGITTCCAWVVASPVVAHYFGTVAPAGLLTSVPAILMLPFVIVFGIIKIAANLFLPQFDFVLFSLSLDALQLLATWGSKISYGFIRSGTISMFWTPAILLWIVLWSRLLKRRWILWIMLAGISISFVLHRKHSQECTFMTIDVGHGTSHILSTQSHNLLIDGGSRSNLDVGVNTILPTLSRHGIVSLDAIFITHADTDHCAGLVDILLSIPVSVIYVSSQASQNQNLAMQLVLSTASEQRVPVRHLASGDEMVFGNTSITILSPELDQQNLSTNDASLVLFIETNYHSILLTGDIGSEMIKSVSTKGLQHVDILELPHHGEWTPASRDLVLQLSPHVVIQSTNIARHKLDKWQLPCHSERFNTAVDGTITLMLGQEHSMTVLTNSDPVSIMK